jgi:hypothetical protein
MMHDTGKVGFVAKLLPNGIHEFTWTSPSREAVDVWMDYNEALYGVTPLTTTLRYLHVVQSANFPPISYVVRKARHLQTLFPEQPSTRSAILFQSRFFGGIINTLSDMLNKKGKDVTRFFSMEEREQAIAWLLNEK